MPLLHYANFESGVAASYWDVNWGYTYTGGKNGVYSWCSSNYPNSNVSYKLLGVDVTKFWCNMWFRVGAKNTNNSIFTLNHGSDGLVRFEVRETGSIRASKSWYGPYTILQETGAGEIANNVWYYLETYMYLDATSGRMVLSKDGVNKIDYTGNTIPPEGTHGDRFDVAGFWGDYLQYDDIALYSHDPSVRRLGAYSHV
jgi:hypothetical protein